MKHAYIRYVWKRLFSVHDYSDACNINVHLFSKKNVFFYLQVWLQWEGHEYLASGATYLKAAERTAGPRVEAGGAGARKQQHVLQE